MSREAESRARTSIQPGSTGAIGPPVCVKCGKPKGLLPMNGSTDNPGRCERCARPIDSRDGFHVAGQLRCFRCAVSHWPLLYRSAKIASVVGTLLVTINLGPQFISGDLPARSLWRIPLNYVVPFCVATWGALSNARRSQFGLSDGNATQSTIAG